MTVGDAAAEVDVARAEAGKLRAALAEIEIWTRPDGAGPDRNVNAAARAALAGSDAPPTLSAAAVPAERET